MVRQTLIIAAFAGLLLGTGGSAIRTVGFRPEDAAQVTEALEQLGDDVTMPVVVTLMPLTKPRIAETSLRGVNGICQISVDPSALANGYNLIEVIWHEWGHCAGLPHSIYPDDIMYPWTHKTVLPTAIRQFQFELCSLRNPDHDCETLFKLR